MKNISTIARESEILKRARSLGEETLSMDKVEDQLIRRAKNENVPFSKLTGLFLYLLSFEAFRELESYWFYLYDPWNTEEWEKVLDHVYRRSITDNHLMN